MRVLQVSWLDPFGTAETWTTMEELEAPDPHVTVGFEAEDHNLGDEWLVLIGTQSGVEGQYSDITCIPRQLVTEMVELRACRTLKLPHDADNDFLHSLTSTSSEVTHRRPINTGLRPSRLPRGFEKREPVFGADAC